MVEQRISNLAQGLLTLGTMTGPLLVVLHLIPQCVLAGLFFIMGVQALQANGITRKLVFLAQDREFSSTSNPLKRLKRRTAIWTFVGIEIAGFGATFAITQTIAAIGFPVIILLLIPIRSFLLPRWFTPDQLSALDAPTASPFTMESVGGAYGHDRTAHSSNALETPAEPAVTGVLETPQGRELESSDELVVDDHLERGELYELQSGPSIRRRSTASRYYARKI